MRDTEALGSRPIPHLASLTSLQSGGPLAEALPPPFRHETIVFYPDPELPQLIDPGLDREYHAGLETRLVAFDEVLGLVAVHAEPVAEAVREERAGARGGDHPARGAVHLFARRARAPQLHRGGLGVVHHVEHLAELVRRAIAEPDGTGDVGGVAAHAAAAIDQDDHLALELRAPRSAVRQRAGRAQLHQPVARRAGPLHLALQDSRHV